MKYSTLKFKNGFSLVEIITILFIVSLGLVGILSLIIQNIQSQSYNKNNLVAYQLAQEGVELVRKVRDSNWKASAPFDRNLSNGQYYMDYLDATPQAHNSSVPLELVLKQDENDFYFHDLNSTATSSPFSRLITLQKVGGSAVRTTVRVTWGERNRSYAYDLETLLYDWK
jgi:type II secretory pathway pseudopilin PulG